MKQEDTDSQLCQQHHGCDKGANLIIVLHVKCQSQGRDKDSQSFIQQQESGFVVISGSRCAGDKCQEDCITCQQSQPDSSIAIVLISSLI